MSIRTQINKIVNSRKQSQDEFKHLKVRIDEIKENVDLLCSLKHNEGWQYVLNHNLSDESKQLFEITIANADRLKEKIEELVSSDIHNVGELDRVLDRIERGEFHFCFMGAWRQGKSFVLDKLLDLGPYIAPNVNQGACTGTVVSVLNNENPKKTMAIVKYYTIVEMCNIINGYLSFFNLPQRLNTDTTTGTIEDVRKRFKRDCESLNIPDKTFQNSYESDMYETLRSFVLHAKEYCGLLGLSEEPIVIKDEDNGLFTESKPALEKLRTRICFWDINDSPSFLVLAVKKVEVQKYFTIGGCEVGAVKFTDTCGIGERRLGIDAELQRVILRDADIAVAVAKVPEDDTTLTQVSSFHDLIAKTLKEENAGKWVYYLINKKNSIASDRANDFKRKISHALSSLSVHLPDSNYQVVQPAQSDEINRFILKSILEPITRSEETIAEVDDILFDRTRKDAKAVISEYKSLKETLRRIEVPIVDINATKEKNIVNNVFSAIRRKVDTLITELSTDYQDDNLDELHSEFTNIMYSPYGYDMADIFGFKIDDSIENSKIPNEILSLKTRIIQKLVNGINGEISAVDGNELYEFTMPRQRIVLSLKSKFDNISDEYITKSIEQIIAKIGAIFVNDNGDSQDYVLSSSVLGADSSKSAIEAIIMFANKHNLFEVSDFFKDYRDLQLPYMKTILNEIEGIIRKSKLSVNLTYNADASQIAEAFYTALFEAEKLIKINLKEYYKVLNIKSTILGHYAKRIQRIKTMLLAPTDQDGNYNNLNQQWKTFYKELYSYLFNADELTKLSQGYEKWREITNSFGIK